jgi:hypothetical protein
VEEDDRALPGRTDENHEGGLNIPNAGQKCCRPKQLAGWCFNVNAGVVRATTAAAAEGLKWSLFAPASELNVDLTCSCHFAPCSRILGIQMLP